MRGSKIILLFWLFASGFVADAQFSAEVDYLTIQYKIKTNGVVYSELDNPMHGMGGRFSVQYRFDKIAIEAAAHSIRLYYSVKESDAEDWMSYHVDVIHFEPIEQVVFGGAINLKYYFAHDLLFAKAGLAINSITQPEYHLESRKTYYDSGVKTSEEYKHYSISSERKAGFGLNFGTGIQFRIKQFRVIGGIDLMMADAVIKSTTTNYYPNGTQGITSNNPVITNYYYYTLYFGLSYAFGKKAN